MTGKATKTIDNLGPEAYHLYERGRKEFEEQYVTESKHVAHQLQADIFEPILVSDHQLLFDLTPKGNTWAAMHTPEEYNDQRKRLFTYQLAPKLGPEEYLEMQIERIEDSLEYEQKKHDAPPEPTYDKKKKKERLFSWQGSGDIKTTAKEAQSLIELLKQINILNKIMIEINSERYRYSKG